jgi:8-oxo-dGTP pyrophosphatase MutT (NUDIX family)
VLLELPAGVAEPGEAPEISAQREIREETGMAAASIQRLGGFYLAPGYSTEFMHIFLATGLYSDPLPMDEDEILQIKKLTARQAYHLRKWRSFRMQNPWCLYSGHALIFYSTGYRLCFFIPASLFGLCYRAKARSAAP